MLCYINDSLWALIQIMLYCMTMKINQRSTRCFEKVKKIKGHCCSLRQHGHVEEEGRHIAKSGKQGQQGLVHLVEDSRWGTGRSVNINQDFHFFRFFRKTPMQCTNAKLYTKLSLVQGKKSPSHTMHSFTVNKIPGSVFNNLKLFDIRNIQVENYHSYSFKLNLNFL